MIDEIDIKILHVLAADGRASVEAVADAVGLSATPTRRRIRNLEANGVIRGYGADIDLAVCGLEMSLYIFIKLKDRDQASIDAFEQQVRALPEISRCDLVTGSSDFILTAHARSMADYDRYLRTVIAQLPGVLGIETSVVISHVKDAKRLPL